MIVFIPYADVTKTMKCLDWKRLGKQRVEAKQLIDEILGRTEKTHWARHPVGKMWEKYTVNMESAFW